MKRKIILGLIAATLLCGCGKTNEIKTTNEIPKIENSYIKTEGEYKGVKYTPMEATVSDAQFDNAMVNVINSLSHLEKSDKTTVEDGDYVIVDYEGVLNGNAIDGEEGTGMTIKIGSGYFPEGVEDSLIGHEVGETVAVEVTLPDMAAYGDMAGKTVTFNVTIREIDEKITVALTDEIAQDNGYNDVTAVEDAVRDELKQDSISAALEKRQSDIVDAYLDSCEFEITDDDLNKYIEYTIKQYESYAETYDKTYAEFIENNVGKTVEEFEEELKETEKENIKYELGMKSIFKREGLKIDNLYDKYAQEIADEEQYDTVSALEAAYGKDEIEKQIICKIGLETLLDNAIAVNENGEQIEDPNLAAQETTENTETMELTSEKTDETSGDDTVIEE